MKPHPILKSVPLLSIYPHPLVVVAPSCILQIILQQVCSHFGIRALMYLTGLGGIMVLSLGGWWFEPWLSYTKDFKIGMCCFLH